MFAVTGAVNSYLNHNLRNLSYIKIWVSYIINQGITVWKLFFCLAPFWSFLTINCLEIDYQQKIKKTKKRRVKRMLLNCHNVGMVLIQDIVLHCISLALEDKLQ